MLEGRLKGYDVLYCAGQWIDHRVPPVLETWVKDGGILYASAGLGHKNEFDEPDAGLAGVLGVKTGAMRRNALTLRPFMELAIVDPIDTITMGEKKIPAIALRQELVTDSAKVLGTWADGKPAVTVRELGKGKAFAVGTAAGHTYYKTGLHKTLREFKDQFIATAGATTAA